MKSKTVNIVAIKCRFLSKLALAAALKIVAHDDFDQKKLRYQAAAAV